MMKDTGFAARIENLALPFTGVLTGSYSIYLPFLIYKMTIATVPTLLDFFSLCCF